MNKKQVDNMYWAIMWLFVTVLTGVALTLQIYYVLAYDMCQYLITIPILTAVFILSVVSVYGYIQLFKLNKED